IARLDNVVEVAALSATQIFGPIGGRAMSAIIAIVMIGSMSGFVLAGSRVTQAIVADSPKLRVLAARTPGGVPRRAILLQVALTLALLLTNAFETVLTYAGFTLELGTLLAIVALIVRRRRGIAGPVRTWGYPATALIYAAISGWTLAFVIVQRPVASLAGAATLLIGAVIYVGLR
ncbi:MAG TPA: amino acid permease, partial [Gemmatimonadaceae bacterium]|nr:amino acid permease [Gemmatimonadaceae bacterium]